MTFKRFVNVIEIVTLVVALGFVVALFANEPGGRAGGTAKSGPGYDVYLANCARCHGQGGQGGVGPKLAGVVTRDFPDAREEIAVVRTAERACRRSRTISARPRSRTSWPTRVPSSSSGTDGHHLRQQRLLVDLVHAGARQRRVAQHEAARELVVGQSVGEERPHRVELEGRRAAA
jgi:hypothetical protein